MHKSTKNTPNEVFYSKDWEYGKVLENLKIIFKHNG